jgi:MFS family permease
MKNRFAIRLMGSYQIGSIIVLLGVGLQSGSTTVEMFIGARFLIGFGTSISGNAAPTLLVELSHPKQRGTMTGVSLRYDWYQKLLLGDITLTCVVLSISLGLQFLLVPWIYHCCLVHIRYLPHRQ